MNMSQCFFWALFCFVGFFSCQVNTSQYLSLGAVKILIFVANTAKSESTARLPFQCDHSALGRPGNALGMYLVHGPRLSCTTSTQEFATRECLNQIYQSGLSSGFRLFILFKQSLKNLNSIQNVNQTAQGLPGTTVQFKAAHINRLNWNKTLQIYCKIKCRHFK